MSYGMGLQYIGSDVTPVQVEAAPGDVWTRRFPFAAQVEGFGLLVTEDFTSQATSAVFSLDWLDKDNARAEILLITIDETLSRGDGRNRAGQTAITNEADIDVGDIILFTGKTLPFELPAGSTLIAEHKTSAGGAGGAVVPVAMVRFDGPDLFAIRVLTLNDPRVVTSS